MMPVPEACRESMERARKCADAVRYFRDTPIGRKYPQGWSNATMYRRSAREETSETLRALRALRLQEEAGIIGSASCAATREKA